MLEPSLPNGVVEVRVLFNGRVQGVGFRYTAKRHADRLGIVGSVSNLADGTVEVFAQGESQKVVSFVEALKAEPEPIKVKTIETSEIFPHRTYRDFKIV